MDTPQLNDAHGLLLVLVKKIEEKSLIRQVEGIRRLLDLVLMEDVAVRIICRPLDVEDVLDALDVHGKTLQPIGDL